MKKKSPRILDLNRHISQPGKNEMRVQ